MRPIKLVDLHSEYLQVKREVDAAIEKVIASGVFIQGGAVREFEDKLSRYMDGVNVVSCGNGTDALQVAMMALGYKPGDEVILPAYTYVATAEVLALLGLVPVLADVDETSFTLDTSKVESLISSKTVAIVPVHLYGQCANMTPLLDLSKKYNLHIIEDAAQSLGAEYVFANGSTKKGGTLGIIGTTSFFPTKNLGAYGDGGALFTEDQSLAERLKMICQHGQKRKYHYDIVGVNSRLDSLQASVLNVKLSHLDLYCKKRREVARYYDEHLQAVDFLRLPTRVRYSTHVFHQYTVTILGGKRDKFMNFLQEKKIPSMIYYPIPLHLQEAYRSDRFRPGSLPVAERLSMSVLSLPIHPEMDEEQLSYICHSIKSFE